MIKQVGASVHVNEGTDNELNHVLLMVTDSVSREEKYCVDTYDNTGSLLYRTGYRVGRVSLQERKGDVIGDTLLPRINSEQRKLIERVIELAIPAPEPEVIEKTLKIEETVKSEVEEIDMFKSDEANTLIK